MEDPIEQGESLMLSVTNALDEDGEAFDGTAVLVGERPDEELFVETISLEDGSAAFEVMSAEETEAIETGSYLDLLVWLEDDTPTNDTYSIAIESANKENASLTVDIIDTNDPVEGGEILNITAAVENTGNATGLTYFELIAVDLNDTVDTSPLEEIESGETREVTLSTGIAAMTAPGEYEFIVRGADDEDTVIITVH